MNKLMLFVDAKAKHDRFAICDCNGEPIWFGKFFETDCDYNGEQSTGEMAAAKKAVWLASKVAESLGEKAIKLTLMVDAQWLTWANAAKNFPTDRKTGGKARVLMYAARRLGVDLTVEHVAGKDNPADKYTICAGYKKWSDNNLAALIDTEKDGGEPKPASGQ